MRIAFVLAAAAVAATALAVAGVLARGGGGDAAPAAVSEHAVPVPPGARDVLVSRAMPLPSAHARRLSAMLERGAMPARPVAGEVLTDTDCEPDAEQVSRCRNDVRLRDGRVVVLRHPHRMGEVPCLAPGEVVRLVPVA